MTSPNHIAVEYVTHRVISVSQTGARGERGYDGGFRWWYGDGAPSEEIIVQAKDGDLYLDETTGNVWAFDGHEPKIIPPPPDYVFCW